jgi:site-specific recombinase XerD
MRDSDALPVRVAPARVSTVAQLAHIPEEEIWLQKQNSARTRRAYRLDVQHFMATLRIGTVDELRQADHKAVIAWERYVREVERAASSTIRRRLAALSSLFRHLIDYGGAARNPAREVARPAINRQEGATLAFSKGQARKLLDLPSEETIAGLRDRAILSVGLQVGLRRAEIAALKTGDLHQNRSYDSLRVTRKGGRRDALAINPQTAARLRAYLEAAGPPATATGRCFGRSSTTANRMPSAGIWTPTRSIAWCGKTPRRSGSIAGTRRTRCAPRSLPRRWRMARSSKTCRKPPDIVTRARRSCMIDVGTTPRRQRLFLLPTELFKPPGRLLLRKLA